MRAILIFVLVACSATAASAQQNTNEVPQVSGTGTVDVLVRPASAVVLVSLTGDGLDGMTAANALQALVGKVTDALKGRAERIIPYGAGFGENPNARRGYPAEPGVRTTRDYLARAGIAVEVRDPNAVPALLTALVSAGIDGIQGVMYMPDENDPTWLQGVTRATELAQGNARRLAAAAGGELGPLIRISMPNQFSGIGMLRQFGVGNYSGPTVPLPVSELVSRISVQGTWEFRPRR